MFEPYLLRLPGINLLNINLFYGETFAERALKDGALFVCEERREREIVWEGERNRLMVEILKGR